jgi:imidazolonepropionase-like amidohydrolase
VVRGVRVFDGLHNAGIEDVLVINGKITGVGRNLAVPPGVETVAGAGRTLLPGLIDSHTHAWGGALHDALLFGVTTELDMFTSPEFLAQAKAEEAAAGGVHDRADLRSAGILATPPGGHGTEYGFPIPTISRPDEAPAWVGERIKEGSDYIKLVVDDGKPYGLSIPTLDHATVATLVAAAHQRSKLVVVHIGSLADARAVLDAGADGLAHLFVDREPDADFGRFVAAHHAFVIPTLSVLSGLAPAGSTPPAGAGADLVKDPRLAPYISPDNAANLRKSLPHRPGAIASYAPTTAAIRQLLAAHAPILAGTDAPNPGTAHGVSLHGEMQLLVAAGLSPEQALAAATSVPATVFHLADRGRIAAGLRADLVLVDGDPTVDILQTRAIVRIWKGGYAVARDAAKAEVADAGAVTTALGPGWDVSTDQMIGGHSTATLSIDATAAIDTAGAKPDAGGPVLLVRGEIVAGAMFAWAGASYSPGPTPFAAVDLSSRKGIHFWAKGDGRTYQVMLFSQSHGRMPLAQEFVAGPEWKHFDFPFAAFSGIDGHDVQLAVVAAVLPAGPFSLRIAGLHFE